MNADDLMPVETNYALLEDAVQRDLVTARRANLVKILMQERFLSREQLIDRVEMILGKGCFGEKAWEDTFYRDMRLVKAAFRAGSYELIYSRKAGSKGYYLSGETRLHPNLSQSISGALAEIDGAQMKIFRQISPAQKFFQAASMINFSRRVTARRKGDV